MGYFSNGSEGTSYQDAYCARCLHDNPDKGVSCPVWDLHILNNYEECNKPDSYLHYLIPRTKPDGIGNGRCKMFVDRGLLSNLAIEKFEHEAAA